MKIRLTKKKEKNIVMLCKGIKDSKGLEIWNRRVDIYKNPFKKNGKLKCKYSDFSDEEEVFRDIEFNKNILKIVRKCYIDKFNIEEYVFSEIIYFDKGFICYLSNKEDIKKYYGTIREIGFWSNYNSGLVIPLSIDESLNNVNHKKCQEAVFCLNY